MLAKVLAGVTTLAWSSPWLADTVALESRTLIQSPLVKLCNSYRLTAVQDENALEMGVPTATLV